jgi:hypothetical protein
MGWTVGALAVSFTQMGPAHLDDLILHRNPIYRDDLGVTCAQTNGSLLQLENSRIFFPIHNHPTMKASKLFTTRSLLSLETPRPQRVKNQYVWIASNVYEEGSRRGK